MNKPLNGKQQSLFAEIIINGPLNVDWQGRYWLDRTKARVDGKIVKALIARGLLHDVDGTGKKLFSRRTYERTQSDN
jgi:hypothetical protein